ncbi:MAG: archaemetzincin family Zn-dependent metalloprotease [Candidatus Solibacter usitatus]|nr:archaemetzincin family Zn-dependent metalloprotease [Candidatus Solibacter usitatus]
MVASLILVRLGLRGGDGLPAMEVLDRLAAALARALGVNCHVDTCFLDVTGDFDELRAQAYSTAILARLSSRAPNAGTALIGVTDLDLYVPVLTFVFGEAQLNGPCAVVSAHRLKDEYYGLPANEAALDARLVKETLHELGHTQGLKHCVDWHCVMSTAHSVERIDVRQAAFCRQCAERFRCI